MWYVLLFNQYLNSLEEQITVVYGLCVTTKYFDFFTFLLTSS